MRSWLVWTLFAVFLAVVLAAMGWASLTVLRLDASQAVAQQQAAVEENVRLALWRMDSALAPLIARESTWPYFAWSPFYPAQRAYTHMLLPVQQGEILMPSPLLSRPSPQVLLHFQIGPDNTFSSPQVPTGAMRDLAEKGYTTAEAVAAAAERINLLRTSLSRDVLLARLEAPDAPSVQITVLPPSAPGQQAAPAQQRASPIQAENQQALLQYDLPQRQERQQKQIALQQVPQPPPSKGKAEYPARELNIYNNASMFNTDEKSAGQPFADVQAGMSRPLWLDGHLLLARRVIVNGGEYIQGCWLDWPSIERSLLQEVRDLLPAGALEPMDSGAAVENGERVLAALPVRLIPGEFSDAPAGNASPLRISLVVAWICMLLAATAVAVLLQGALSLSERRGAFVSAVTHEMRTPLTTFRMYTEMLVKGMVPADKRTRYLDTLRIEADRLAHLVENVLSYARLERGKMASRLEVTTPAAVVERARGRLADRAEQAGMVLHVRQPEVDRLAIQADPTAVEQILFNLVDNACKYAAGGADKSIHLGVRAEKGFAVFEVSDHGPGIAPDQQGRLFRPFSKSAQQAAHSAPGVGLGLALSRRLARRMGGDLSYDPSRPNGATFILRLPRTAA